MTIRSFRDLKAWQKAVELALACCRLSRRLPREETFGLASQLRRSAVSVPANIAEGHGRMHRGDYVHHLSIARGSLAEVETHLHLIQRLTYVSGDEVRPLLGLIDEEGRILNGLINALKRGQRRGSTSSASP